MIDNFLYPGETIVEGIHEKGEDSSVDYSIHVLNRDGITVGDEVLLEIRDTAEPCVLIGGHALELTVESGFGRLAIVDLKTGGTSNVFLEDGTETSIPTENTLYWYENMGSETLVIRDHCDEFDPANEPSLAKVVAALTGPTE